MCWKSAIRVELDCGAARPYRSRVGRELRKINHRSRDCSLASRPVFILIFHEGKRKSAGAPLERYLLCFNLNGFLTIGRFDPGRHITRKPGENVLQRRTTLRGGRL